MKSLFLQYLLIYLLSICIINDSQLSKKTKIQTLLNTKENDNTLDFVAVFLLTTLEGSTEFHSFGKERHDFFQRVRTSKQTWAHPIKHYYAVIGESDENRRILSDRSLCQSRTEQYRKAMAHLSDVHEEVYRCNGIDVLHLPYCDPTSWGPMGPCCRCEGAMKYYLNMASVYTNHPRWFMFSDDDYYTRTYKLQAMLSQVDSSKPYAVNAISNPNEIIRAGGSKTVNRQHGTAHWFSDKSCKVPCTHASQWYGYAVFSYGAMKAMEKDVRRGGLIEACRIWDTTHDVGLGVFVWELALPFLPVCCGPIPFDENNVVNGVFYHAVGKQKEPDGKLVYQNDMMQMIWDYGVERRMKLYNISIHNSTITNSATRKMKNGNTKSPKIDSTISTTPSAKIFQEFEYQEGLDQFVSSFPIAGFENSLFYRKVEFSETVAHQVPEQQLKTINSQLSPPQSFPIRRTSYSPKDCKAEMDFHLQWRQQSVEFPLNNVTFNPNNPNDHDYLRIADSPHYPKMCVQYLEAVMNTPIHLEDLPGLPPLDDLERRIQRRKMVREG